MRSKLTTNDDVVGITITKSYGATTEGNNTDKLRSSSNIEVTCDTGSTTNGKIAAHWQIVDSFAVRSTYSTGFRAPTPGQSNAYNVSTEFNLATNELENNGTIPATSAVAALRGGQALDPEESTNFTAGVIWQAGDFSVTVDYFDIDLEDRLGVSQNFVLTDEERQALIDDGVAGANSLQTFRFFTNGIETNTWTAVSA